MITEFFKPATVAEAVELKRKNPDALFMAGGSWINSSRSGLNPEKAISVTGLNLTNIEKANDVLSVGAAVTLQELADFPLTPKAVRENLMSFRNRNIRNQGTLAGAIAAKQPAFQIIPLMIALQAELILANGKIVSVEEYVLGPSDDLILSVRLPLGAKAASAKHSVTERGVCLVSVAAGIRNAETVLAIAQDGGKIERLHLIEQALKGRDITDRDALSRLISENVDSFDDYRTSAEFKAYQIGVLLSDCLLSLAEEEE